jgi:hypothetical protein
MGRQLGRAWLVDRGHGAGFHVGEAGRLDQLDQLAGVGEREGTRNPGGWWVAAGVRPG